MIVADGSQMVVDGGGVISRTIDPSDTCGFPTSRERLLVAPGHRQYITSEERYAPSVNMFFVS